MKTLSVRQPWAHLICSGLKDVENRSWRTNYRGKVLIHSPAKFDGRALDIFDDKQTEAIVDYFNRTKDKFWDGFEDYLLSTIIGSVEIVNCVRTYNTGYNFIYPYKSIWAEEDSWHWILKNPVLFDKPILNVKGRLSFWNYEGDL